MVKVKYIWIVKKDNKIEVHNHVHNCYEIIYYFNAEGHVDYFSNQKEIDNKIEKQINYIDGPIDEYSKETFFFKNNTFILLAPRVVHNEIHDISCNVMDIGFEIDNPLYDLSTFCYDDYSNEIGKLFLKIKQEFINKDNYYQDYIESLVEELVISLNRLIKEKTNKVDPITLARNYIKENFTTNIDLNNLANISGYGIDHFRFLFKNKVGMSPKEYIINKRISLACHMLKETDYSISKVASFVGYDDVCQFSVIFKKKMETTPLNYKKNNQTISK